MADERQAEQGRTSYRNRVPRLTGLLIPDWRPDAQQKVWTIRLLVLLVALVVIGNFYGITLWDWAKLLIVPAAIAAGGIWFNQQQRERERYIENQRAKDEALEAYLDQIGQLLLDKENQLRTSSEGDEVRMLGRARTLTVVRRLDAERKRSVVQFLYESKLVGMINVFEYLNRDKQEAIIDLRGADLSGVDLGGADLNGADLSGVDLSHANLRYADMINARLAFASLRYADLTGAELARAVAVEADFTGANLTGATGIEELEQQVRSFEGATMPNGSKNR